ncbi:COMM domain-containing protein 1 [Electrophorus electricus]|uniref:COMM domain-containing protein 1 n=1 Tax=Electrophorus electricus TaxID=8005 RepID=A0A4W4GDY1_ELEEL|nr:COMM domain-containing protein 1 [Electrophorus electricus]
MSDADDLKALSALLNGIAQKVYYGKSEISEELLKSEIYPDASQEEFHALHEKMRGLLKSMASADMDQTQLEAFLTAQTRKHGGVSTEQAAALARFWKAHRARVRDSLQTQSRWEPGLRALNWRVDVQTASSRGQTSSTPVALVELELGRNGQDSEFVSLEFDELRVNQVLKKLEDIQKHIDSLVHHS